MDNSENIIRLYFKSLVLFKEFNSVPRKFGTEDLLYSSEIHTIQAVGRNPGINITELSEAMDVSKSATSKFIVKMIRKGYVSKTRPTDNNKEVVLNLTPKGQIAYKSHERFSEEVFQSIYQLLSHLTSEECEFLESFLSELVARIEEISEPPNAQ